MTVDTAVETVHLRKVFGAHVAVDDLSLQVHQGEIFGLLGPNGAGKSTLLKMLLGLAFPTRGSARVLGRPVDDVAVRGRMGFLPEHLQFHDWMTAGEFLDFHASLYGMPAAQRRRRAAELLDLVQLTPHRARQLRTFSKGMLQRVGLAQALLNEPDLIFLDEPTSGLDPIGRILVRDIMREQRRRGATVFLNSHLLSEVEVTCNRVAFIKQGQVIETRELDATGGFSNGGEQVVTARVRNLQPETLAGLDRWCHSVELEGESLRLGVCDEAALPAIVRYLALQNAEVFSFQTRRNSLEDLFLRILGDKGGL